MKSRKNHLLRRHYRKSEATRASIVEAAVAQLIDEGYRNFSVRKVAFRAGVSIGKLQHHFVSKENLISVMLDEVINAYLRDFEQAIKETESPEEQLRSIVMRVVDDLGTRDTTRFFPELWSMANHDPSVSRMMQKMYERYQEIYHRILPGINPKLNQEQIRRLGLFIVATLEGHTMFVGYERPLASLRREVGGLACECFLQIIKTGAIPGED